MDTVCIVGMGPSHFKFMTDMITQDRREPMADEIWTINCAAFALKCDRVFWMDDLKKEAERNDYCVQDVARLNIPVITSTAYPSLVPKSEAYPIDAAVELSLDLFGCVYLPNTICYAIALCMMKEVKTIKLYGADFTYINRNFAESGRAAVEAWLTFFKALGGNVVLPDTTSLFNRVGNVGNDGEVIGRGLYGYDVQPTIKLSDGRVMKLMNADNEIDELGREMMALINDGAAKNAEKIDALRRKQDCLRAEKDVEFHRASAAKAQAKLLEVSVNG